MNVSLRQLEYFVKLAEELHFSRAAEQLHITQPALSHQIAQLEEELRVPLLIRTKREVRLTSAGERLLTGAKRLLEEAQTVLQETRTAGGIAEQKLTFGYVEFMNLPFLARALKTLREQYPNVHIERREMYSARQVEALLRREIDLGFVQLPLAAKELLSLPLLEGYWSITLPQTHRLAAEHEIPLLQLRTEPLILFAKDLNPVAYEWLLERLRKDGGFEPHIVYETAQSHVGPRLVAEGLGLLIVASYVLGVLGELPAGVVTKRLAGFDNVIHVGAAWHRDNRSPILAALVDSCRQNS